MSSLILEDLFQRNDGQLHMAQAIAAGVSRSQFYAWRDHGLIEAISRGIYRLTSLPVLSQPDLVIASLRFPRSVVCLLSALSYHGLTTHIPHALDLAVTKQSRLPQLDFPPIQAHRFSDVSFLAGIETHQIDNVPVRIYDPEKTLVDCFKFRHKIGLDLILEALNIYKKQFTIKTNQVMAYAKICRVDKIITPYMESLLCL